MFRVVYQWNIDPMAVMYRMYHYPWMWLNHFHQYFPDNRWLFDNKYPDKMVVYRNDYQLRMWDIIKIRFRQKKSNSTYTEYLYRPLLNTINILLFTITIRSWIYLFNQFNSIQIKIPLYTINNFDSIYREWNDDYHSSESELNVYVV